MVICRRNRGGSREVVVICRRNRGGSREVVVICRRNRSGSRAVVIDFVVGGTGLAVTAGVLVTGVGMKLSWWNVGPAHC